MKTELIKLTTEMSILGQDVKTLEGLEKAFEKTIAKIKQELEVKGVEYKPDKIVVSSSAIGSSIHFMRRETELETANRIISKLSAEQIQAVEFLKLNDKS